MKRFFSSVFFSLFALSALRAQDVHIISETYLSTLPKFSFNVCSVTEADTAIVAGFFRKVNRLNAEVKRTADSIKQEEKKDAKKMEESVQKKSAADFGISAAEMQQMKSGKMTPEQKMAMAEKMIQGQNINISVEKASKTKTEEGKKEYATSIEQEQTAEAAAKSDKEKTAAEDKRLQQKSISDLVKEKSVLTQQLDAKEKKLYELYREIEADSQRINLKKELDKAYKTYEQTGGEDYFGQAQEVDQAVTDYNNLATNYCNLFTPRYTKALDLHKSYLNDNRQNFYRLEELNNEINSATTGYDKKVMTKGILLLEGLHDYLLKLKDVFIYSPRQITFQRKGK